jgi:hypothetical protein
MKSLMSLLKAVLHDCSILCDTTTTRDFSYISRRVEKEGIAFLAITLSDFATDFEKSLEHGHIESTDFRSFRKSGLIPKLFSGITTRIFDTNGRLLDQPCITAIFCIRQVCRMWKKIQLPCKEKRDRAAIQDYIKLESELAMLNLEANQPWLLTRFGEVSKILWGRVLQRSEQKITELLHVPNHGSGATSLKVPHNQKYVWREWHERLESYFPSSDFCYNNSMSFLEESSKLTYLSPERERPVRVVFVPKTLKAPRVIGIEPACNQYTQQSLMSTIVRDLEEHYLTRGHVNFKSQNINAKLALDSSKSRLLATLDLSEASDRVHNTLVNLMLARTPNLLGAVQACRSLRATLPTGQTIQLEKFASMGSALCFPIESMVFYTILIESELRRLNLRLTLSNVRFISRSLFVYGDDLIVPVDSVSAILLGLSSLGLKVNTRKSFSLGNFRESCGMDAYDGVDVTTVYLRRMLPKNRRDVSGIVSCIETSNQLYDKKLFTAAQFLVDYLGINCRFTPPVVGRNAACVGLRREYLPLTVHRYNKELHRHEVFAYVPVVQTEDDVIDGYPGLMKWFLKGLNPDKDHYKHSVGSGRLTWKRRWSTVY